MTATATLAPVSVTTQAHAVLHMALGATDAWPKFGDGREEIFSAVVVLGCTLKDCREAGEGAKAAEAADALIFAMNKHCGPGWGEAR